MERTVRRFARPLRTFAFLAVPLALCAALAGCSTGEVSPAVSEGAGGPTESDTDPMAEQAETTPVEATDRTTEPALETITLGAGCYWCVEAVLEQLDGVHDVVSGFMGGEQPNPTYTEVCTGRTGHAEVVQVKYDTAVIPTEHVLAWFWKLHDPTTLNRQGADVGTQYRSAIFYHSDAQRELAERSKEAAQSDFEDPIVTEITAASEFYVAKEDHQDYYRQNKQARYCQVVIAPKLEKLKLEK